MSTQNDTTFATETLEFQEEAAEVDVKTQQWNRNVERSEPEWDVEEPSGSIDNKEVSATFSLSIEQDDLSSVKIEETLFKKILVAAVESFGEKHGDLR
ncbi:7857_t:CDS:2 [Dentiscutata erythropus]|uniref:7857_t:CDS:1 n=1 Tax=Dentiscutata erythropus TaxID=1348616 RepID=A0A9N9F1C4_9GLOM|nr:7857_t:CDS:2 [Dentiscutata erythropus]